MVLVGGGWCVVVCTGLIGDVGTRVVLLLVVVVFCCYSLVLWVRVLVKFVKLLWLMFVLLHLFLLVLEGV